MELTLSGLTSAQFEGPVTIELPAYMYPLEPEEMAEARVADNCAQLAFAAGRHPDGNILFVTGDGTIREIDSDKWKLPKGAVTPIDHGQTIAIHLKDKTYELATDWAIENSSSLLSTGANT